MFSDRIGTFGEDWAEVLRAPRIHTQRRIKRENISGSWRCEWQLAERGADFRREWREACKVGLLEVHGVFEGCRTRVGRTKRAAIVHAYQPTRTIHLRNRAD